MKIDSHMVQDTDEELHDIINPEVDKRIFPQTNSGMQFIQGMLLILPIFIATT